MICVETKDEKKETLPLRHKVQSGPPGFLGSWWSLAVAGSSLSVRLDQANVKHWADEKCGFRWIKPQEIDKGGRLSSAFFHSGAAAAAEVTQLTVAKAVDLSFAAFTNAWLVSEQASQTLEPGSCRWDFVVVCFSPEIYRSRSLIKAKATSVSSGKHPLY